MNSKPECRAKNYKLFKNSEERNLNIFYFSYCTILICIGWLIYSQAFHNDFVYWDDQYYVSNNLLIQQASFEHAKLLLNRIVSLNYHPITMLSIWCNSFLSGIDSAYPFIITNVTIHILNSILTFAFLRILFGQNLWLSIIPSLLFLIHPMHVESVVWVSERKDVLYAFFFLCSLINYTHFNTTNKRSYLYFSFLLFVLSCLSKAVAVTLVPCLFLLDLIQNKSFKNINLYLHKIPFIFFALLIGLVAIDVQSGSDFFGCFVQLENTSAIPDFIPWGTRLLNALYAHQFYLSRFIFPNGFSAFHPYSITDQNPTFWLIMNSFLSFGFFVWTVYRKNKTLLFGLLFYVFTISTVLQLIPVGSAIVAERYTYLPYIGLSIILALILQLVANKYSLRVVLIFFGIFVLFCSIRSRNYSQTWKNHISLFSNAMNEYPENGHIRKILANGYYVEDKFDQALYHLKFAIEKTDYNHSSVYELLGNCYADIGNPEEALIYFDQAIKKDPLNIPARYHRGLVLLELNPGLAIQDFDFCEMSQNHYILPLIYAPRGRAYGLINEYEKSIDDFTKAIEYHPNDPYNYLDRAVSNELIKNYDQAKIDREKAEELKLEFRN